MSFLNKKLKNDLTKDSYSTNILNQEIKFPNLIPLIKWEYRASMMNHLKNWFCDSLLEAIKAEREYCKAHPNVQPLMTQDKIDHIQSILDKINDVYELEALSNFIFLENIVPTYEEVKQRGLRLKLLFPNLLGKQEERK